MKSKTQKNKDRIAERKKEYQKEYREKNKDKRKEYREKNKDRLKDEAKEYREKNKDRLKVKRKKYREKNKGKIKDEAKKYREKNKDRLKDGAKKYREIKKKKTYSSDEAFLRNLVYMKRSRILIEKKPQQRFNLTYEQVIDIYNKQERKCFYSGLPFVIEKNHPMSISIDRIDNNKGYTIDNIALCLVSINQGKSDGEYKNLIPIFKAAIKHYKKIK